MPLRSQIERRLNEQTQQSQRVSPTTPRQEEPGIKVVTVEARDRDPGSGLIRVTDSAGQSYRVNELGVSSTLSRITPAIIVKGSTGAIAS